MRFAFRFVVFLFFYSCVCGRFMFDAVVTSANLDKVVERASIISSFENEEINVSLDKLLLLLSKTYYPLVFQLQNVDSPDKLETA